MMVRTSDFTSKPPLTNSAVIAWKSGSLDAGLLNRKSSTGLTRPRPKKFAQTRFTIGGENSGFDGFVVHFARYARRSVVECAGIGVPSRGRGGSATPSLGCSTSPSGVEKTVAVSLFPEN